MSLYGSRLMSMSRSEDSMEKTLLIVLGILLIVNLVLSSVTLYRQRSELKKEEYPLPTLLSR